MRKREPAGQTYAETASEEFDAVWVGKPNGDTRVLGAIEDGSFRYAYSPLYDDFVLTFEGKFVGE